MVLVVEVVEMVARGKRRVDGGATGRAGAGVTAATVVVIFVVRVWVRVVAIGEGVVVVVCTLPGRTRRVEGSVCEGVTGVWGARRVCVGALWGVGEEGGEVAVVGVVEEPVGVEVGSRGMDGGRGVGGVEDAGEVLCAGGGGGGPGGEPGLISVEHGWVAKRGGASRGI